VLTWPLCFCFWGVNGSYDHVRHRRMSSTQSVGTFLTLQKPCRYVTRTNDASKHFSPARPPKISHMIRRARRGVNPSISGRKRGRALEGGVGFARLIGTFGQRGGVMQCVLLRGGWGARILGGVLEGWGGKTQRGHRRFLTVLNSGLRDLHDRSAKLARSMVALESSLYRSPRLGGVLSCCTASKYGEELYSATRVQHRRSSEGGSNQRGGR